MDIFDILDGNQLINAHVLFAATRWDRVPKFGPEDINVCAVVDRQLQLEATVATLSSSVSLNSNAATDVQTKYVEDLKSAVSDMENKIANLSQNMTSQFTHLTSVCQQLAATVTYRNSPLHSLPPPPPSPHTPLVDRSMNVVVYGLAESRDSLQWRDELANVLRCAAGRDVPVTDALRIGGRFVADRTRPVLVKLQTVWDRRLVLSGTRKLGDDPMRKHVFVKADESVEVRRHATLKRLLTRATREGKNVKISDDGGLLHVDGVFVFSLAEGFVKNSITVKSPSSYNGANA